MFAQYPVDNLFSFIPEIGEKTGSDDSVLDTQFPHISKTIIDLWGSIECMEYMEGLINFVPSNDRPTRQGFPLAALLELHIVIEKHHQQFPYEQTQYSARKNDPWNSGK